MYKFLKNLLFAMFDDLQICMLKPDPDPKKNNFGSTTLPLGIYKGIVVTDSDLVGNSKN
jgi:hypothetical protein